MLFPWIGRAAFHMRSSESVSSVMELVAVAALDPHEFGIAALHGDRMRRASPASRSGREADGDGHGKDERCMAISCGSWNPSRT